METKREVDPLLNGKASSPSRRLRAGQDPALGFISPLFADLSGLPPLIIQAGTHEVLLDDAVARVGKPPSPTSRSRSTSPLGCRTSSRPSTRSSTKRSLHWIGAGQLLSADLVKCGTHHRVAESPTPVSGGMHRMSSITSSASDQRRASPDDRRWLILIVVSIAQLMVVLDSTVVNIALPSAQRDLGFGNSERQWVVTAYALAFGSLLLLGGRVGDLIGRKRVFIGGLAVFALASAAGGAAPVVRRAGDRAGGAGRRRCIAGAGRAVDAGNHLS